MRIWDDGVIRDATAEEEKNYMEMQKAVIELEGDDGMEGDSE